MECVDDIYTYINRWVIDDIKRKIELEEEPARFLNTILFKTYSDLDTVRLLLKNFDKQPTSASGIFLILRTILSDYLIFNYLLVISGGDEQKFVINIKTLYIDHTEHSIKSIKNIYQSLYGLSAEEIESDIRTVKNWYSNLCTDSGIKPKSVKFSAQSSIRAIGSFKENKEFRENSILAFEYYERFSKYEHYGVLTNFLVRRSLNLSQEEEILRDFYDPLKITVSFLLKLFEVLYPSNRNYHFILFSSYQKMIILGLE